MTLKDARSGSNIQIIAVPDEARAQLIRLGIAEGSRVVCQAKIPFGPVVLRARRQEIAVGRVLAGRIEVK